MKKFHKRAAVFLTAATLAGLPAGAFFYSSPGSLTVWADNVEVESSEESSPEDVDFSDGSEDEILADPVEQAQEDAGNDVTETPEVGITFTEPEGWQTDTATVKIQVEDTKNTGAFSIAKVEARLSENGGWSDITGNMEVSISSNCSVYVRVTDQNGSTSPCPHNLYDREVYSPFLFPFSSSTEYLQVLGNRYNFLCLYSHNATGSKKRIFHSKYHFP